MAFTDEEREENTRTLKKELLKVDFVAEYKSMDCDLHIVNGRNHGFLVDIVRDNRLVMRLDLGPLSYTKKQPNGSTIEISHTKANLEDQLKNNTPFLPYEVRKDLDIARYFLKHEPIESNPRYTSEEKEVAKAKRINKTANLLSQKTNELIQEFTQLHEAGKLLTVMSNLADLPTVKQSMTGEALNKMFQTDNFKDECNYHKFQISFTDGGSHLIVREANEDGRNAFAGAIMSYQDGLYSLQRFKPIQSLDKELLREILNRPTPEFEITPEAEPEVVKSNILPFEKPVEAVEELDHEIVEHDDSETEVKRKRTFKP